MAASQRQSKSPARVAAGRLNVLKRRAWTVEDRERQRLNCLKSRPWERSTGPRTPEGKQQAATNGSHTPVNPQSTRQAAFAVADIYTMISELSEMRRGVER